MAYMEPSEDYRSTLEGRLEYHNQAGNEPGDPAKAAQAIMTIVNSIIRMTPSLQYCHHFCSTTFSQKSLSVSVDSCYNLHQNLSDAMHLRRSPRGNTNA